MAQWVGDFNAGARVDFDFTTVNTSGITTAITGGSCCVRKVSANTPAAGLLAGTGMGVLTASGGLNHVTVFTGSDSSFFVTGADYFVFIGYGLVSGNDIVGSTVGQFSMGNRGSVTLAAAQKVDVDTIKTNPVVNAGTITFPTNSTLASTTNITAAAGVALAAGQKVDVDTIKTNPVVNAGTVTFPTTATLASTTNITAGTITTVTNLTNAPTAGDFTATMKAATLARVTLVDTTTTATNTTSANVTQVNAVNINSLISGRIDATASTIANGAIASATFSANALDSAAMATSMGNEIADLVLLRDLATGASATDRNVQNTLRAVRNKTLITTTGQLLVYQEDDATLAWAAVTTTATATSLTSVDPN